MSSVARSPLVYLDYAAAAPPVKGLHERWGQLAREFYPNPHGTTQYGAHCKRGLHNAEQRVLAALDIPPAEASVIWTSGGTEAVNLAIHGVLSDSPGGCVMADAGAHASVLAAGKAFCRQFRRDFVNVPVDRTGGLVFDGVKNAPVAVMGVSHVNNETGAVTDLPVCRKALHGMRGDRRLLVDALQSAGRLPIPWRGAGIDLLTLGGRKIGGPPGVGALILRKGVGMAPLLHGGGQQHGLRPGTVDTAAVILFADILHETAENADDSLARAAILKARLSDLLARLDTFECVTISPDNASPYITCVSFPGFQGAVLMRMLAEMGVVVGSGSACMAESRESSHVLQAMGYDERIARGVLRISFGRETDESDVDRLVQALQKALDSY